MLQGIPYRLYAGSDTRLIVHLSLCGLGLLLVIITFVVQFISPAPYGKHENKVFPFQWKDKESHGRVDEV